MSSNPDQVSVTFGCVGCGVRLRAECDRTADAGQPTFYDLQCPVCGKQIRPFLPGPVITVAGCEDDLD